MNSELPGSAQRIREALNLLTSHRTTKQTFNAHYGSPEMLEGLISKGYVELHTGDDEVYLTLAGAKALLDMDGVKF